MIVYTLQEAAEDETLCGVSSIFDLIPRLGPDTTILVFEITDQLDDATEILFRREDAMRLH